VAELIAGMGLTDYYRFRSQPAQQSGQNHDDKLQFFARPEIAAQYVHTDTAGYCEVNLLVEGFRCAACGWLIERGLGRLPGVTKVGVSVATARVRVEWDHNRLQMADLLRALSGLGYQAQPVTADSVRHHKETERRNALRRIGVAGIGMMQVMMYVLPLYLRDQTHMAVPVQHYLQLISMLLTTPVMFYSGWPFLYGAVRSLGNRTINMDVPVTLALLMAYLTSVYHTLLGAGDTYFDSVTMFVFLLSLGRYVEMVLRHRSASRGDALASLQPVSAQRYSRDSEGNEIIQEIPVSLLQVGDDVLIRAGAVLPADGEVTVGCSTVDESMLTGEAMPQIRTVRSSVLAGTVNVESPIRVRISAVGGKTALSGVIRLLERAQADKPRLALAADRVARYFLQILIVLSILVGIVWWHFNPERAFEAILAVLVVSCPCALSLATPAVIAAASAAMARRGLLITHGDAIEKLASISHVVFDKTGTLSTGIVSIGRTQVMSCLSVVQCHDIAASLEIGAEHPVARAFQARGIARWTVNDLHIVPGGGVQGVIEGITYRLGSPAFAAANKPSYDPDDASVVLSGDEKVLARFELTDPLRADAIQCVRQLNDAGISTSILSGDAEQVVESVAAACGINQYQSRCKPEDKLKAIQQLQSKGEVAMVGDGINDAPVLSAAGVSIAMGAGSGLAHASADAVLLSNQLSSLPCVILIARRARKIMRQNLYWAAFYNITSIPLAALGLIPPWLAAIGMSLSSVLVVLNAARLLRDSRQDAGDTVLQRTLHTAINPV